MDIVGGFLEEVTVVGPDGGADGLQESPGDTPGLGYGGHGVPMRAGMSALTPRRCQRSLLACLSPEAGELISTPILS